MEPDATNLARNALPVGLLIAAVVSVLWHVGGVSLSAQLRSVQGLVPLLAFAVLLICTWALHEAIHAVAHPGRGVSDSTVLGFSSKPLVFYATYLGEMTRNRYTVILLAPVVTLSLLPSSLCALGVPGA